MLKLGITGNIGSGKSTAARFFKKRGAFVFHADNESKIHLVKSITLQKKIIRAFGNKVTNDVGKLDLKALAEIAFLSPVDQQILNRIVWPEVFILVEEALKQAELKGRKLFIVDAALIFEANLESLFDKILLIFTNPETRVKRLIKRGDISKDQIEKRMQLQMPDEHKKSKTDYAIENDGSLAILRKKLNKIYHEMVESNI